MKPIQLLLLIALAAFLGGCASPIKTTVDYTTEETGMPQLKYSSEKDIRYTRKVVSADGSSETVSFEAIASDPTTAFVGAIQAQGEAINALVNGATAQGAINSIPVR